MLNYFFDAVFSNQRRDKGAIVFVFICFIIFVFIFFIFTAFRVAKFLRLSFDRIGFTNFPIDCSRRHKVWEESENLYFLLELPTYYFVF